MIVFEVPSGQSLMAFHLFGGHDAPVRPVGNAPWNIIDAVIPVRRARRPGHPKILRVHQLAARRNERIQGG